VDPSQHVDPYIPRILIRFDPQVLLVQPPSPATVALKLLNQSIRRDVMVLEPRLEVSVSNHDPNMPGSEHAGGELVTVETDPASGLRHGSELVQGLSERLHSCRFVLGRVDRRFVEPDVVASSANSTGSLVLVVSGNYEA